MLPSVAVVTPSLNQGRFIERTVRSVLDQHYEPLTYVVCDGGSTDDTLQVLEQFGSAIRVISEPDRGQADAVNKGIQNTSSELIGWLNSDDVYSPGALAAVGEIFAASPEADVVYGEADLIGSNDEVLGRYYTEPWNPARLPQRCFVCQPAAFLRRRVIERFGLLDVDLDYTLDYEYWLRLAAGGAVFKYVPITLAGSRLHAEAKTLSARLALHEELNRVLRLRLGRVPNGWLINHAHTLVEISRARGRGRLVPYAFEVVIMAAMLESRWNRRISAQMLRRSLAPIVVGARRRLARRCEGLDSLEMPH